MRLLALLVLLSCCSAFVRQELDSNIEYRRDIELDVRFDGKKIVGRGVLALPQSEQYEIRGSAVGDFDFLVWQTCAQQHSIERRDNDFKILFSPVTTSSLCNEVLEIRGVEEEKGRNQGAILAFDNPKYQLRPSSMICNGETQTTTIGVSVCQAKQELVQSIDFSEPVIASGDQCGFEPIANGDFQKHFVYKMPIARCPVIFGTKDHRKHLLILFPYQDIIITRKSGN